MSIFVKNLEAQFFSVFNKDIKNSNLLLPTINVLKKLKIQPCISLKNLNYRTKILYLNLKFIFINFH